MARIVLKRSNVTLFKPRQAIFVMKARPSIRKTAAHLLSMLLVPLALGLATPASAAFIDFSGQLDHGFSFTRAVPQPFAISDPVSGFIEIDDAAMAPGARFRAHDLRDFSFTIGVVTFDLGSGPFINFGGRIANDGESLHNFGLLTAFNSVNRCRECALVLTADSFTIKVADLSNPFNLGFASGTLDSSVRTQAQASADIPEPTAFALFIASLALIGWGGRRNRSLDG